ncbi:hypothetical protein ACFSJY_07920 [Thalassotalea euphylliae]|uniref:hypothetical protein n=1 Tax=Thalassotalea euphylliae TaxID=1655234 RepID=UPI0036402F64
MTILTESIQGEAKMEFDTPKAIRHIKNHNAKQFQVNGKPVCRLEAMAFALNYHTLDIVESPIATEVIGMDKVQQVDAYVLKR